MTPRYANLRQDTLIYAKNKLLFFGLLIFCAALVFYFLTSTVRAAASDFSLSIWVKPSGSVASKAIAAKAEELRLVTNASSQPLCQIKVTAWQAAVTSSVALTAGVWTHVLCVYDQVNLKIFVNGMEKGSVALTPAPDDTANALLIGRDASAGSSYGYFPGIVDDFKFYPYALTAEEVKLDYNQGKGAVMGSTGKSNSTATSSNAASLEYCVPGSTDYCAPPVGEWKFDEKTGVTAYDTSGNGNDGTLNNSPAWTRGKVGSALNFISASYQTVNLGQPLTMQLTGAMTISAWVKPTSLNTVNTIMAKGASSGQRGWGMYCSFDESCDFAIATDTNNVVFVSVANVVQPGTWVHITGVYAPATSLTLYKNGIFAGAETVGIPASQFDQAVNASIGSRTNLSSYFNGLIDQARIYNYARTPAQIAYEFNRGQPIVEWRFDECSGSTIYDSAKSWNGGTANNGTLNLGSSGVTATGTCASSTNSFWYNGRIGKVNSGGSFDGVDDYVDAGNNSLLNLLNNFTIGGWIKRSGTETVIIAHRGYNGQDGYAFGVGLWCNNNEIDYTEYYNNHYCLGNISNDSNWHHILVTKSDLLGINTYVDGKLVGSDSNTTNLVSASRNFYIGVDEEKYVFSNGQIDEVKIWNYALTAEQVKAEYTGGAVRFGN